ncbi:MAG: ABC transporter substrate-binding protein [Trueperaceae bacterium]|nr:ABC transporter substrate-binding protein [Trueperaceae bacterium]
MRRLLAILIAAGMTLAAANTVEIFSWWAGDEGPALEALIEGFEAANPDLTIDNVTVTGGAGVVAKAVLKTRMLGGDPPDSFQAHIGKELIDTWVIADRMEDLTFLFEEEGWLDVFPPDLIDLISTSEGIWSVPVNIHRSNVMWYVPAKLEEWGISAPETWEEFLVVCPAIQAQGVTPLALAENWTVQHLWESIALAALGPDDYDRLWTGELAFNDPKSVAAFELMNDVLACANADAAGLSWQQATDRVVDGEAAFNVMGDWAAGYMFTTLGLEPGTGFGWAPAPGTDGIFMVLSDSFGLPLGAPNREGAIEWLRYIGSLEGTDTFNPIKGAIAPRTDTDLGKYNAYLQSAAADFASDRQVGSLAHGTVANENFMSTFAQVMEILLDTGNAQAAANAAQALALQTGVGR